jgi:hypothetical protein
MHSKRAGLKFSVEYLVTILTDVPHPFIYSPVKTKLPFYEKIHIVIMVNPVLCYFSYAGMIV